MDDYDPACPTEDDVPFEEIDLSQVPLPPSLPPQGEVHDKDAISVQPSELEGEEKRTGRRKKRRKRSEGDLSLPEAAEDKEDDETSDHCPILESAESVFSEDIDDIPVLLPAVASDSDDDDDNAKVDLSERDPPVLVQPEPVRTASSSSAIPAAMILSAATIKPGQLHFKLTPDPSGGKAKVSFQLKKSVKSTFHAAEDDEEEGVVEEEGKDIVEKTAAGEYIPTRFKVSKKHEIYRPSLVEPSLNIVFPTTVMSAGGASSGSSAAVQGAKSNTTSLTVAADTSAKLGMETRSSRGEEDSKAAEKNRVFVDSPRELRRSERRDKKKEDIIIEKNESSSRSTRRISRGGDRDVERHVSLRSSYSRREQSEGKYKEQDDKNRKAESIETNEKWRSSRSKRSESDLKKDEKRSTDRRHDDNDSDGRHHNHERSPRHDKNASPVFTGGRRTRSSHRNRSHSKERDSNAHTVSDSCKPDVTKDAGSNEMAADRLTEETLLDNDICDRVTETSGAINTPSPPLTDTSSAAVEEAKTSTDEVEEKHPHIQKIVIRRSLESNDFEIAKNNLVEGVSSEDSPKNPESIVCEKKPANDKDSSPSGPDNDKSDSHEKEKYSSTKEEMDKFDAKDTPKPHAQQRNTQEEERHRSVSPEVESDLVVTNDRQLLDQEVPEERTFSEHEERTCSEPEDSHRESSHVDEIHKLAEAHSDSTESEKLFDQDSQIAEPQEVVGRSVHITESHHSPETNLPLSESEHLSKSNVGAVELQVMSDDSSLIAESQRLVENRVINVTGSDSCSEESSHVVESKQLAKKSTYVGELPQLPHIEASEKLPKRSKHIEESEKLPTRNKHSEESEKLPTRNKHSEGSEKLPTRSKHSEGSEKLPTRSKQSEESEKLPTRSKHSEGSEKLPTRNKHIEESEKLPERNSRGFESHRFLERKSHIGDMPARNTYIAGPQELSERSSYIAESQSLQEKSSLGVDQRKLPKKSSISPESRKVRDRYSFIADSERGHKKSASNSGAQNLLQRRPYVSKPGQLPEQVLVDVTALPGKSKWEMDDDDDPEVPGDRVSVNEDKQFVKDFRLTDVSHKWPVHTHKDSIPRLSHRSQKATESSSNEDDMSQDHRRHKDKDKAEKRLKKKRKHERSSLGDNVESGKASDDFDKGREEPSRNKPLFDNSKIVNYLKEYSRKEEKTSKAKTEIDSVKLVAYLKEYSGKMLVEPSLHDSPVSEGGTGQVDDVPQKRISKDDFSPSKSSRAAEEGHAEDVDFLQGDGVSEKEKECGIRDPKGHVDNTAKGKKREVEELEQRGVKDESGDVSGRSRSSSHESNQKEKNSEQLPKKRDESSAPSKEKRGRSLSSDRSEGCASKSSQRSRDRRDRSESLERSRKNKRHRSRSVDRQDDRRWSRRRSRSRSPAWRSRDRRNRSRSLSQDRRSDRRNRSRSRERNYSYRSYKSPGREGYNRTRRDKRDRRGRSRSGSYERSSTRRHRSSEGSPPKSSKYRKKSKSPEKKSKETSSGTKFDTDRKSDMVSSPANLSSIPIPDANPLPHDEAKKCTSDRDVEEVEITEVGSIDKLQDEPMKISNEEKGKEEMESSTTDDLVEIPVKLPVPEHKDVVKTGTGSKTENKNANLNPATLACGKDRQIKFSILGASKKVQSVLISGVLDDDFEPGNVDDGDYLEKDSFKSSVIVDDGALGEKSGSDMNTSDRKEAGQDEKIEISSLKPQIDGKIDKLSSSPANVDGLNDSKLLDNEEDDIPDENLESLRKRTANSDKETSTSSSSPKRLKFKYIPLWEMEENEKRPIFEVESKKVEKSYGLALDYGSGSSDYEDEEDSGTKQETTGMLKEECPVEKSKEGEKSDDTKDSSQNETQNSSKLKGPAEDSTQDTKLQTFSEEADTKPDVIDQPAIQHKTQIEAKEQCPESQLTECYSETSDSSEVPSESDNEAYSPSHPSMEDPEVSDDDAEASAADDKELTSVVDSKSVSKLEKDTGNIASSDMKRISPGLTVSDSTLSDAGVSSASVPVTSSNLPVVTSADITSINIACIPLPEMLPPVSNISAAHIPHVPPPVNPPGGAIPSATVATSLIRQPFSGLQMPLSHPSLLTPPLRVPRPVLPPALPPVLPPALPPVLPPALPPVLPPALPPVPPPTAAPEGHLTNIPLSSSATRPVPPPPQQSVASPQSALAFGVPRLSSSSLPQISSPGQLSRAVATMIGAASALGASSSVRGIQGGFRGASVPGVIDIASIPPPAPDITFSSSVKPVPPPAGMQHSLGTPPGGTIPLPGALPGRTLPIGTVSSVEILPGGTVPSFVRLPGGTVPAMGTLPDGTVPSLVRLPGGTVPPSVRLPGGTVPLMGTLPGGLLPSLAGTAPSVLAGVTSAGTLPCTSVLPATEVLQRSTLPSVPADTLSTSPSLGTIDRPVSVVHQQYRLSVDSVTSGTSPVRFRINRFHQSPPVTQVLPPPSIAIPLPTLAFPSALGSSVTTTNTITSVPFVPALPSSQQHTSAIVTSKSGDTKQLTTPPITSQKPAVTATGHLKRPKISSILSQSKFDDPAVLRNEAKMIPSASTELDSAIVKSHSAKSTDLLEVASSSSEKQSEHANDSKIENIKTDNNASADSHTHKQHKAEHGSTREEKAHCSDSIQDCPAELTKLPTQSSERDISVPQTAIFSTLNASVSTQSKVQEKECIPLPDEVTSSVDSQVSPVGSPQPSRTSALPRPPSSPPKQPPPPPTVPESDSSSVTSEASSRGQTVSSSHSDRKKRFSQSPLAIGMLPKVQMTQSPLAAGPLPKLPPEPEENNNSAIVVKRKVSSPVAPDVKSTVMSQTAKQKKLPLEKEESKSTSKIHFVFKSKSVLQKTLISAFDDEESDDNEGEPQASSSEASHSGKSLTSAAAGDKKGTPRPLSAVSADIDADTEKQAPEKEIAAKESAKGKEQKSKIVSLTDIEAFPVQVITSSRKVEDTPAASWPEFTVAKKRKDEESGNDGKRRSRDRDDKKKSRRYSHERERDDDQEHRRKKRYLKEDKKHSSIKRCGSRSEEEDNNDYNCVVKIKKEKEDDYEDSWSAGQDNKSNDHKKGHVYDEVDDRRRGRDSSSSYNKRKNRHDDNESDYKRKSRDIKDEKYSRRRDDKDDDYTRRRHDESRRTRHSESGRSRERSWDRDKSRDKDKSDRGSGKSSGKRHHRSKDGSHSRSRSKSPSGRKGRSRDHSRDGHDRHRDCDRSPSRSRSHSQERGSSSSSRRKDSKTFKEELLEELTKPSVKANPKEDLFKVTVIGSSSQPYVSEYQTDPAYSSGTDGSLYSLPHHAPDLSGIYPGQDFNLPAHYPPSYEHQEFTSCWEGQPPHTAYSQVQPAHTAYSQVQPPHTAYSQVQPPHTAYSQVQPVHTAYSQVQPAHTAYNQVLAPQHQDIHGQYPPVPPEQVAASHPYPFQPPHHFPPPGYPNNQILTDPYHPVSGILQQQLPQLQHPVSGPPTHIHIDQHGQPIPTHYPPPQTQVPPPPYALCGPPINFQPHIFTQETRPPVTPADFHLHLGPRPRPPLLPTPVRSPLPRASLVPQNFVEASSFSAPDVAVSSPGLQMQPEHRPPKKSRFSPLEEGTFSPVIKTSLAAAVAAASSSPTVGSPSTTSMLKSETTYTESAVSASNEHPALPEPSFETSLLAESEFDTVDIREAKKSSQTSSSKRKSSMEVNEPIVSSSGVEDSTGDTGSDSGTDSSSQRPLKVKSRWRSNSEADAVVVTSKALSSLAKQLLDRGSTPDISDFSYERCTRSRTAAVASTAELEYANLPMIETPSPSPPSRKRAKTESEIADMSEKQENDDSRVSQGDGSKDVEHEVEDIASLIARPDFPKFEIITENIHLTERKRSKSMKRMLCDCTSSREDRSKGITACGSDCLNRMLMIECGSRCPCSDYCTNKRFQKKQYSRTVPFKAGDKGWGLRADEDMEERGTFIMEYVGELLDYEEFVRRTRQYSKAGLIHHYFMALNADEVIDATLKGSISRFINHSCDPNCETQKWTVNGELRVGFFTRKPVTKGEELTFDYQFEHYGEAQKCYCGAENCRGYIGLVKSPTRNNRKKEKKKKEIFKDELLEEEIEELSFLDGMRNKNHVLDLCRLMVRAEKVQHRMAILKILQDTTETACLRLFLDYHGLPLLWSWMADIGTADYSIQTQELKLLMMSVLKSLPITNKTALRESKIPDVVERWAVAAVVAARKPPPPPPPATTATTLVTATTKAADSVANTTVLTDNEAVAVSAPVVSVYEAASAVEEDTEKAVALEPEATTSSESSPPASPPPLLPSLNTITPVSILASAKDSKDAKRKRRVTFAEMHVESLFSPEPPEDMDENDDISSSTQGTGDTDGLEGKATDIEERLLQCDLKSDESLSSNVADSTSTASDTDNSDTEALIKDPLASLAAECISLWSSLKEVFKIPKRERVEERKRTERELDVLSKKEQETSDPYAKWKRSKVMKLSKRRAVDDDDRKSNTPKMSKEERRQLFEAQVKKEDELAAQAYAEEFHRQQEAYMLHQQRLLEDPQYFYFHQQQQGDSNFAGLDPSMIPPEGHQDAVTGQPIPNETLVDPNIGQPIIDPNTGQAIIDPNTGQALIDHNIGQPLMHHPPHIDPNTGQHVLHQLHIDPQTGQPVQHIDPLAGQFIQHIDPVTGQPVHQIDPLTGHPITPQIDPLTGQLLQHQMEPLMPHPNLQHVQFDPSIEPPMQHQHPVLGPPATPNFQQQQQQPQAQHLPAPPQNSNLLEIDFEEEVPPPPSPPTVPVTKLPLNWKTAKDAEGRVYYYHAFTRQTQWEMPSWEDNDDDSDDMEIDPIPVDEVIKAKKKTTTAAADTSSEVARKIKDHFRSKMSNFIVTYLNPYRKQDCKIGRIVSTDDFKHLARKLTHHVMSKELKHCRHVEDLEVNENVKAKAKDYVRKYMSKFGTTFRKSGSPHPDDPAT